MATAQESFGVALVVASTLDVSYSQQIADSFVSPSGLHVSLVNRGQSIVEDLSMRISAITELAAVVIIASPTCGVSPSSSNALIEDSEYIAVQQMVDAVLSKRRDVFVVVYGDAISNNPELRYDLCSRHGAHMVTHCGAHLVTSLQPIARETRSGEYTCAMCKKSRLTAEELWRHVPQFHVNNKKSVLLNSSTPCPICNSTQRESYSVHIHDRHPPANERVEGGRAIIPLVSFGLCVIQRKRDNKFLVVQEYENQGYWLPGGGIDTSEMPDKAAMRECLEEAGIHVKLTGILRVEVSPSPRMIRMRYIFYGHPVDDNETCKTFPDFESVGACWVSIEDLSNPNIMWRGSEPYDWFTYVSKGGHIAPMDMLTYEGAPPIIVDKK